MTSKQLKDLQQQTKGQVTTDEAVRKYFSTDGSIFTITPEAVAYPRNTHDVQAVVSYVYQQNLRGKNLNVVARGKGTDQAGGALGDGIILALPAHMNKILRVGKDSATVQPGVLYSSLQRILHMHERFLPPYPSSIDYSTIGGAAANNACGEKTLKYGSTREWVKSLKVVLADGSEIETKKLTGRELNRKKGLMTLEGEIYRRVDSLIRDNSALIHQSQPKTTKNSAGYALGRVRQNGYFDLSQLFIGAQGTLGVITEVTLKTAPYNPRTTLVVGYFDDLEKAGEAVLRLQKLKPSAMEVVDYHLLKFLQQYKPETLKGLVPDPLPKIIVLIEFDNTSQLKQNILSRRAARIVSKMSGTHTIAKKPKEQEALWQVRHSAAAVIWMAAGKKKSLPIIEDGVVPVEKFPEFLEATYKLLNKFKLDIAVWGHAGDANLHLQPIMDLSKIADRKKIIKLMNEFYTMVIKMGGSTCGEHNDGLLRAPYLEKLYGPAMYRLFEEVKDICDPHNVFNPRIKLGVQQKDLEPLMRREYSMEHLYDHMPHT
ncbi:MAG TPA: FAD-binding oxidoreductase [Candidatus Dormibacteraeota bacterium]|nr:FAD-binding oxidoreductase [Candidatus Dormibacteraeota bacterium]